MKVTILQPKAKPVVKKKVCAYARVSTSSSSQEESLENQTAYYERLIKANPEYEFVGIFSDKGYTGTKNNRPEFQEQNLKTLSMGGELILNTKRCLGYDKDKYGDLVINQKEAKIVRGIFEDYLSGKGILTVTGPAFRKNCVKCVKKTEVD